MDAETQYWSDKAALLDPNCYIYKSSNAAFTVVEDEPVFIMNCWQMTLPDHYGVAFFHRKLDADNAVMVPPGFALRYCGAPAPSFAYVYYAKPSLVTAGDERYASDPRGLYFSRLQRLRGMVLHQLWGACSQNQTASWIQANGYNTKAFPTDFERGLLVQISTHNLSWMTIQKNGANPQQILATLDEADDIRPLRSTSRVLAPFKRSLFPHLFCGMGSMAWAPIPGQELNPINPLAPGKQTYPGVGSVLYYKLPADW